MLSFLSHVYGVGHPSHRWLKPCPSRRIGWLAAAPLKGPINGADKPARPRYRTGYIGRWRWMALSGGGRKVRRFFNACNLAIDLTACARF
jgi:hypothetical protein